MLNETSIHEYGTVRLLLVLAEAQHIGRRLLSVLSIRCGPACNASLSWMIKGLESHQVCSMRLLHIDGLSLRKGIERIDLRWWFWLIGIRLANCRSSAESRAKEFTENSSTASSRIIRIALLLYIAKIIRNTWTTSTVRRLTSVCNFRRKERLVVYIWVILIAIAGLSRLLRSCSWVDYLRLIRSLLIVTWAFWYVYIKLLWSERLRLTQGIFAFLRSLLSAKNQILSGSWNLMLIVLLLAHIVMEPWNEGIVIYQSFSFFFDKILS